ncbi:MULTISPECIES: hypothetical protein [Hymenobacter]|uniref:Uncharacterized protein n=1 Tax=Hymenobacter jejuensis TaxID=2502781 RepID=A0A5B7ZZW9_9BACT|nr:MULTISPECIES: hypothetical protein [Hymenobacter]MBC6991202.1 hypothetical protein [Hymenobacter sp. BT491]QDA60427.1 hypothetical protein FHG12_10035 [Hymenobacter jejuensis]
MRKFLLLASCACLLVGLSETQALAQQTKTKVKGGYHGTSASGTRRARSGAYMAYNRANRRNEEDMKLAPGMRINMPAPPTTDYMGRPLKKKTKPVLGATSISSEVPTKTSTTTSKRR